MKKDEAKKRKAEIEEEISKLQNKRTELQSIIDAPEEITKEQRFVELLNGCTIKIDKEKYPGSIFFFKGDEYYFEIKKDIFWCNWKFVWLVFERGFEMDYQQIQAFIKDKVEEHFKCKGLTPLFCKVRMRMQVEEHFKCKGLTPDPFTFYRQINELSNL